MLTLLWSLSMHLFLFVSVVTHSPSPRAPNQHHFCSPCISHLLFTCIQAVQRYHYQVLECPDCLTAISRLCHLPYPLLHLNFPPFLLSVTLPFFFPPGLLLPSISSLLPLSTCASRPSFLTTPSNVPVPSHSLSVSVRRRVGFFCVSLCVTGSCRKLGWLTLIATRCLTLRYSHRRAHTQIHTEKHTDFSGEDWNRQQGRAETRWVTANEQQQKGPEKGVTHQGHRVSVGESAAQQVCTPSYFEVYRC